MNSPQVTISFTVSDALCASVLCTAIESGYQSIGYWADVQEVKTNSDEPLDELYYASFVVTDVEEDEGYRHLVDYEAIRRGIAAALDPESSLNSNTKGYISSAVTNDDGGDIDADAADAIVQFACFGKLVYG